MNEKPSGRPASPEPSTTVRLFLVHNTSGAGFPEATQRRMTVALMLTL